MLINRQTMVTKQVDGDQETYLAVKSITYHPLFITMCPTYAFIDRADGKLNRAMDFKREYSALISAGWDIDNRYDAYLVNSDADSYANMQAFGLADVTSEESRKQRDELIRALVDGKITGRFSARYVGGIE